MHMNMELTIPKGMETEGTRAAQAAIADAILPLKAGGVQPIEVIGSLLLTTMMMVCNHPDREEALSYGPLLANALRDLVRDNYDNIHAAEIAHAEMMRKAEFSFKPIVVGGTDNG